MKIKELSALSKKELQRILPEKREELRVFYFKSVAGRVKNAKQARELKKDIARILTLLNNLEK